MRETDCLVGVLASARRGGKTAVGQTLAFLDAVEGGKVWYVAPTYAQCKELFFDPICQLIPSSLLLGQPNRTELSIRLKTGGTIWCKSADRPEALAGRGLTLIVADEYQDLSADIYSEQFSPLLAATPNKRQGKLLMTGTPRGLSNPFYLHWSEASSTPRWRSWLMTAYTANMIPPDQLERLRSEAERRGRTQFKLFKREYLCDWGSFVGQVFDFFEPSKHVTDAIPTHFDECIAGVDWGFSETHPGVCEVLGRVGNKWWTIDEVSEVKQTLAEFWMPAFKRLARKWPIHTFYCDPSQPGSIQYLRNNLEQTIRPAINDRESGLLHLASMLESGELLLSTQTPELVRKLPAYQWERDRSTGHYREQPKKIWDDEIDALRYAIASRFLGASFGV